MLSNVLQTLGLSSRPELERTLDALVSIGVRYGLPCAPYQAAGSHAPAQGWYLQVGNSTGQLTGHMLQIFVQRSWVNELAYPSQPMGVVDKMHPSIESFIAQSPHAKGQARLFAHPDVFLSADRSRVFHYCANPELCSTEASSGVVLTRGRMILELQEALAPVIGSQAAIRRARAAIEGH